MRPFLVLSLLTAAAATPALAQGPDRYGGYAAYPTQPQAVQAQPERVLTWPGKTMPSTQGAPAPQASGYVYQSPAPALRAAPYQGAPAAYPQAAQRYVPAQAYPRQPQAAQAATYPSGLRAQPYYAPAPAAPAPSPGSTATAPSGVYPPNTVPPGYAYPLAVPPQMAAPLVGAPQQPTSIYSPAPAPAPQAKAPPAAGPTELNGQTNLGGQARPNPTDLHLPQRLAMNAAEQGGARFYSLHRQFGLQPDPTPPPAAEGQAVQLVTPIDSGGPPDPASDDDDRPRTRTVTTANGKTVVQMRGSASASPDN